MVFPVAPGGAAAMPSPAGSSPIRPTQNAGSMVNGIAKVRQAIKLLASALSDVMEDAELAEVVMKSIKSLGEKAPANKSTAGAEQTQLQLLAQQARAQAPMLALARQAQPQQTPGAA